jgi:uncharacterized membrane protein HdeD (DUF308 family)
MVATVKEYGEELWWLFILQGIATIGLGILALFMPGVTLVTLVVILSIYAIIVGITDLIFGFSSIGRSGTWWFSLLSGLVILGIGVYLIRHPFIAVSTVIVFVGTILLLRGIFDLVDAAFFSTKGDHRLLRLISGILGVIAGLYIWENPASGGIAFIWALGLYALITGAITLAYSFQIRSGLNELRQRIV